MVPFFLFVYFILCLFSLLDISNIPVLWKSKIYIFLCFFLSAFTFIILKVSGDYVNYADSFENIESWTLYLSGSNLTIKGYELEPGYVALELIVKALFSSDVRTGVAILTILGLLGLLLQIPKYTKYILAALIVYFAHFYWWLGLVLVRQMIAMAILFPIVHLLAYEKYWKAIFLVILASLFHASMLVVLLLVLFIRSDFCKTGKSIILVIFLSLLFGYMNGIKVVLSIIGNIIPRGDVFIRYISEGGSATINPIAYCEMLLLFFLAYRYRDKLHTHNNYTRIAIRILLVSLIVTGMLCRFEIASRFAMLFNFYSFLILVPSLIGVLKCNLSNKIFFLSMLLLYMMIFLIRFVAVTAEVDYIP